MKNINVIDKAFIDKLSAELKNKDGVSDVDLSDIGYEKGSQLYYYNNVIRVMFDYKPVYGFKLEKFNVHDADADANKLNNFLDQSDKKLDEHLDSIAKIKTALPKIKAVVNYVESLKLDEYINIKKVGFSCWSNQLMITIYTNVK